MKHAKKMMLVDIPNVQNNESYANNDLVSRTSFAENYIKPQTAFNLDQDLRNILNRTDLDDHEKWMLYNQSHQRFLFLLDEERKKNINNNKNKFSNVNVFNKFPSAKSHNSNNNLNNDLVRFRNFSYPIQGFDHIQIPKFSNDRVKGRSDMPGFDHMQIPNITDDREKGHFDFKAHSRPKIVKKIELRKSINELFNDTDENMSSEDENENSGRHREKTQDIINRARPRRLANEFNFDPNARISGENELGIINERKRKSDQHYQLPAKRIWKDWSVSLDRLPHPLTPQIISQIIKSDKKNRKIIHDWELMPRNTRSRGRIGK